MTTPTGIMVSSSTRMESGRLRSHTAYTRSAEKTAAERSYTREYTVIHCVLTGSGDKWDEPRYDKS